MDEKENNFDYAALVSLISCVRNEANLNAQISWKALGRQLSFTGFLIVGLGLLYKPFGDIAVILIAAAGDAADFVDFGRSGRATPYIHGLRDRNPIELHWRDNLPQSWIKRESI